MATIELAVPTVHCTSCKLNIEECLQDVAGVLVGSVDLATKQVTVDYDPRAVAPTEIVAAIEDAGYAVA